jgi:hypothetical protein
MSSIRKKQGGTFIYREMYESRAFLNLGGFAPQLLVLFLGKRWFEKTGGKKGKGERVCVNGKDIRFTYIEAQNKYGITKSRFSRAIDDLLAKGFITVIHPGGGYKQDKAVYGLSENWRHWLPGTVFEARKRERIKRGFCRPKKK